MKFWEHCEKIQELFVWSTLKAKVKLLLFHPTKTYTIIYSLIACIDFGLYAIIRRVNFAIGICSKYYYLRHKLHFDKLQSLLAET